MEPKEVLYGFKIIANNHLSEETMQKPNYQKLKNVIVPEYLEFFVNKGRNINEKDMK